MNLPKLTDSDISGKKVLVRADLDLVDEIYRLEALLPTLKYLSERQCQITLIGHRGKPSPEAADDKLSLSLGPVGEKLKQVAKGVNFTLLENLRFDPGEMENSWEYAKKLAENQEVFINESFAESHREVASIVSLPKLLPHAAGLRFCREVDNLSKVQGNPHRPLVVIISGVKEDKLTYLELFMQLADKLLVGGRLPEYLGKMANNQWLMVNKGKIVVADLLPDKEDITIRSIEKFEEEIAKAGTIVLAGPLGKYEEAGHRQGTDRVFKAVANSGAYKVAGGGDTVTAISELGLEKSFDWISVGGGAMLEFLAKGTLPGIEALII